MQTKWINDANDEKPYAPYKNICITKHSRIHIPYFCQFLSL